MVFRICIYKNISVLHVVNILDWTKICALFVKIAVQVIKLGTLSKYLETIYDGV